MITDNDSTHDDSTERALGNDPEAPHRALSPLTNAEAAHLVRLSLEAAAERSLPAGYDGTANLRLHPTSAASPTPGDAGGGSQRLIVATRGLSSQESQGPSEPGPLTARSSISDPRYGSSPVNDETGGPRWSANISTNWPPSGTARLRSLRTRGASSTND